ncbi:hypothetical protein GCM10027427_35650 [Pseudoclavibacter terrae]
MAIRKRPSGRKVDEAAIEAFASAAESDSTGAGNPSLHPQPARRGRVPSSGWPDNVARSLLVRYPDPELPALLAEVAALEERSNNATAVRALRRGLEVLLDEARSKP